MRSSPFGAWAELGPEEPWAKPVRDVLLGTGLCAKACLAAAFRHSLRVDFGFTVNPTPSTLKPRSWFEESCGELFKQCAVVHVTDVQVEMYRVAHSDGSQVAAGGGDVGCVGPEACALEEAAAVRVTCSRIDHNSKISSKICPAARPEKWYVRWALASWYAPDC